MVLSNRVAQRLDDEPGDAEIPGGRDPNIAGRTDDNLARIASRNRRASSSSVRGRRRRSVNRGFCVARNRLRAGRPQG
jgi:hypothetical protein